MQSDFGPEQAAQSRTKNKIVQHFDLIPGRAGVLGREGIDGKEKEIGSLETGKRGDLIALDLDEIGWSPRVGQDIYTALVYSVTGQHVRDVMVNGKWLFRNNRWLTVDFNAARRDLEQQHSELMRRIKK